MADIEQLRQMLADAAIDGSLDDILYLSTRSGPAERQTKLSPEAMALIPADTPIIDYIDALPQIECSVDYLTHEALLGADEVKDAQGNIFAGERFQSGNYTRVFVRKYAPDGVTLLGQWAVKGPRGYKIDGFGFAPSDDDFDVRVVAHDTPQDPVNRFSASGRGRISGVFVPFGNQLPKAGAASADPQIAEGEPVDYDQIRNIVRAEVERGIAEFSQSYGDDGPRKAIFDKSGDSQLYMNDPDNYSKEWKVGRYQDVTFKRDMDRLYVGLNKHIIGENPNLPVENQGFIDLMEDIVERVVRRVLGKDEQTPEEGGE